MRAIFLTLACFLLQCITATVNAGFPDHNKTLTESLTAILQPHLDSATPELQPGVSLAPNRRWAPLNVVLPSGGQLMVELPEYVNGYGSHLRTATDAALFSGRTSIASQYLPDSSPQWRRAGDAWTLEVDCTPALTFTYTATSAPGRVSITCGITNNTGGTLERIVQFHCCAVSSDSVYFSRDPASTHFLLDGRYTTWSAITDLSLIWREGMPGDTGVHWLEAPVRGSGRKLNPYPRRAVIKGEVDNGVIVQDHRTDPQSKMILIAEPGGSIFKNCNGGCIHANPGHGSIANGTTSRSMLTILFIRMDGIEKFLESTAPPSQ